MSTFISRFIVVMIFALSLSACSNEPDETTAALLASDGLLKYVPADTPYLLAMTAPLPDDVLDKLEPQADASLQMYPAIIKGVLNSMIEKSEDGADIEALQDALPFLDELAGLLSVEGLRASGVDRESLLVVYGAGLLPVIRITLSDSSLMEDAVARLEESAAKKMSVETIDNQEYRYAGNDQGRVIVAIIENELVVSLVPTDLSEEHLRTVLGLSLPEENIAESRALQNIADKYDFDEYMIGFFDIERLVSVFIDDQSGINAELLALAEFDGTAISDACKADARSMAGVMPRIVAGYTDFSVERMSSKVVFELRPDLAMGVATLTGPVPGLGGDHGGIFSMGMSTDILAAREFYSERLDELESNPYECEELSEMQAGVAQGRQILDQPVPPIVYGFNGFLAVIEDIVGLDVRKQQPPTSIDMRLLVSMDNAEGLLAMGAMFSPELAALNIELDGKPVKLEMGQIAAMGQTVHIAMTDSAVAISVGEGTEARLSEMLAASVSEPSPFMTFDMDAARYYEFIGDAMMADQDLQSQPELQESVQAMFAAIQDGVSRVSITVDFTEHGIELNSTVSLTQ